jgi:CRISPR/Cas system-associated exonuclease Cas4 (RecB family)
MWNLSRPSEELSKSVRSIKLRGDRSDAFLTGEFARKIAAKLELDNDMEKGTISHTKYEDEIVTTGAMNPLSVSAIADIYCPTRRDLYLAKGLNRPRIKDIKTWGRIAGPLVEKYVLEIMNKGNSFSNFSSLIERAKVINNEFAQAQKKQISKLSKTEGTEGESKIGDTRWFQTLLDYNGRAELGMKILNSSLKEDESLDAGKINREDIYPNPAKIGISSPASPDFLIKDARVVGDIKTGINFESYQPLTCAGYALAYENQRDHAKMNWGIIYFFPTRNPTPYVRPVTFAQVYIFPIDDQLRRWFLSTRDDAYRIVSRSDIPTFPDKTERTQCPACKFYKYCIENGLEDN